jgi:hypothetical protein
MMVRDGMERTYIVSNKYKDLFEYYDGENHLKPTDFRISPSSIHKFFGKKREWYGENLLGEEKKFTGSSATILGTAVHACCEVVANAKSSGVPHDSEELHEAIDNFISEYDDDDDIDTSMIRSNWKNMAELLIKEYVLPVNTISTEQFITYEVLPGIVPSGTYDAITSTSPMDTIDTIKNPSGSLTLRDWKTSATKPSSFSYAYKLQAATYCYILSKQGIKIDNMELCFAVRPTKTLPVRVLKLVEPYTPQLHKMIEGIIKLIADSVQVYKDYPDIRYLLAGDYRLKQSDIPRP